MKIRAIILFLLFVACLQTVVAQEQSGGGTSGTSSVVQFDFCGVPIQFDFDKKAIQQVQPTFSQQSIQAFQDYINNEPYQPVTKALIDYKKKYVPDDWLYYQLIRKTAQQISPKADNYLRYTLCKWFLLTRTGYDAILALSGNHILFYVRCDENIYNIPTRLYDGKQYVCLNYHDYETIDFEKDQFTDIILPSAEAQTTFSYRINHLPEFKPDDYFEKDLHFNYNENDYHFKVKLNSQIQSLFTNYPTVDYDFYLNIPLSKETYQSLIPLLKKNLKGMNTRNGVDYLMRFTRNAFLFETDTKNFGGEKRLSPEQTLLYNQSDCEDRVALFYCLVKEIYNLPMIVLSYPKHVTIAVQFDKPVGKPIIYDGHKYYVCEPTPQKQDLQLGQMLPGLARLPYEITYVYRPEAKNTNPQLNTTHK